MGEIISNIRHLSLTYKDLRSILNLPKETNCSRILESEEDSIATSFEVRDVKTVKY